MALIDHTLFGIEDKVKTAIDRLRTFEPAEGYYLAFSGGKDSVVIKDLAIRAGVRFDAHYNATTVDPPELVQFIRREHPDVIRHQPAKTMWQLVAAHGTPPTRLMRYCCREIKEIRGGGRLIVTGVRWAESVRRSKRMMVETCLQDATKQYLHPIIDWTEADVWAYIRAYDVPYCKLYDEGWKRLGCVMCPQGGTRQMRLQAERWPKIAAAWRRAIVRAYDKRIARGDELTWKSGDEMYEWWISGQAKKNGEPGLFE